MYGGATHSEDKTDEALALMGLKREAPEVQEQQVHECYPDNWLPMQIFSLMSDQWHICPRTGMALGLRSEALLAVMDMVGIPQSRRAELFASLREMTDEAKKLFGEQRG